MYKKLAKIQKAFIVVLFFMVILNTFTMFVFAAGAGEATTGAADPSQLTGSATDVSGITNIGNQLITIVSTVGSVASVIVLIILGLKYMMGSAEEKAEYKKTLLPYVIGAGLVFAASAIAGIVFSFTKNLSGTAAQ